jgi:probable phosphoglycerate mutase
MLKIMLVRHGETDWNRVKRVQGGSSDTPLNDIGREQAKGLAGMLAKEQIKSVIFQPLAARRRKQPKRLLVYITYQSKSIQPFVK